MQKKYHGFTLLELVVSLSIVVITATIAVQAYSSYVRKGRRLDGVHALLSISLAEERYRASNTSYGTLAQVWSGVSASPEGYYTLAITNVTATTYTLTATAQGNQANDVSGSTSCATLQLTNTAGTISKTPAACWPT